MANNVEKVFAGFLMLSPDERRELIEKINEYQRASYDERKLIKEGHQRDTGLKMDLGPTAGSCPCCGS